MVKLLLCTLCAAGLAACVLHLRQQRLALNYQSAELHDRIKDQQAKLWNQQLQIATFTAPNAITETVGSHKLDMVPRASLPPEKARWIDPARKADAE